MLLPHFHCFLVLFIIFMTGKYLFVFYNVPILQNISYIISSGKSRILNFENVISYIWNIYILIFVSCINLVYQLFFKYISDFLFRNIVEMNVVVILYQFYVLFVFEIRCNSLRFFGEKRKIRSCLFNVCCFARWIIIIHLNDKRKCCSQLSNWNIIFCLQWNTLKKIKQTLQRNKPCFETNLDTKQTLISWKPCPKFAWMSLYLSVLMRSYQRCE